MTEVALPANHRLVNVKHYEAGPPEGLELVEPGETFATTKEEEWISKKKTEVTNTKQIETRVKRQVVLEDGKVVEDSGPMVTTNTTEDTETQEHHQTELRKLGDDDENNSKKPLENNKETKNNGIEIIDDKSKWITTANPDGIVREVKEKKVVSREEIDEIKEMEDIQHYGDITDEQFIAAVSTGKSDLRKILKSSTKDGCKILSTGPRLINESLKSKKVTDTENTNEKSSILPDGKIITETQRTTEHEEINDDELPNDAPEQDYYKENSQRYLKTRDQEDVDYLADGKKIGHEMRFKTETMEAERNGDVGLDEIDFDSLSTRLRRRNNNNNPNQQQQQRLQQRIGLQNGGISPLDRKDALTKRPLDFDKEEETRKVETSKWLEHHFGSSESRSSKNSIIDDDFDDDNNIINDNNHKKSQKTSFFNVTIKSQPTTNIGCYSTSSPSSPSPPNPKQLLTKEKMTFITTIPNDNNDDDDDVDYIHKNYQQTTTSPHQIKQSNYYKGISEWSERSSRQYEQQEQHYLNNNNNRIQQRSPIPDYNNHNKLITPTPPQRRKQKSGERQQRPQQQQHERLMNEVTNYRRKNNTSPRIIRDEPPLEEPPPDYSPPPIIDKKQLQKTRFAPDPPKAKSGNIIGQSIRKLVGKIRSASAERKAAKQRAKQRSPSPSYQKGHIIDNINNNNMDRQPVQRYYLGEDPFAGSIYGRENKYDGVQPVNKRKQYRDEEQVRSQSTLGRFSKSTGRLVNNNINFVKGERNSQTLPRHLSRHHPQKEGEFNDNSSPTRLDKKSNSTINVSIINTVSTPTRQLGPAKPARTYRSNLSRSKSLNVHGVGGDNSLITNMYTSSNPYLNRLDGKHIGLKSPGLISSLNRSHHHHHKDVITDNNNVVYNTNRFNNRNVMLSNDNTTNNNNNNNKRSVFIKDHSPIRENDDQMLTRIRTNKWKSSYNNNYNGGDIYEPPTRLRDNIVSTSTIQQQQQQQPQSILRRRGSNSSTDYSETYHTTTRNDDPLRPSVTNTVKSFTKKTIPSKNGRSVETIESSETKSITKSHYKSSGGGRNGGSPPSIKFYENNERRYSSNGGSPVVIEVRNNNYRK